MNEILKVWHFLVEAQYWAVLSCGVINYPRAVYGRLKFSPAVHLRCDKVVRQLNEFMVQKFCSVAIRLKQVSVTHIWARGVTSWCIVQPICFCLDLAIWGAINKDRTKAGWVIWVSFIYPWHTFRKQSSHDYEISRTILHRTNKKGRKVLNMLLKTSV